MRHRWVISGHPVGVTISDRLAGKPKPSVLPRWDLRGISDHNSDNG